MTLAVIAPGRDVSALVRRLEAGGIPVVLWPSIPDPNLVRFALVWRHPAGVLRQFPNLCGIQSLGAGVDHLSADTDVPDVPVARFVDEGLSSDMAHYVSWALLDYERDGMGLSKRQRAREWSPRARGHLQRVGLLGLGSIGLVVAEVLMRQGRDIRAWRRKACEEPVLTLSGPQGLVDLAAWADAVVCLLPLTSSTRGILSASFFNACKPGLFLVNVARGEHLEVADLLEGLASGRIGGACLDVFEEEPPGISSPLWNHPQIRMTPHEAAISDPLAIADLTVENYGRALEGRPLRHAVTLSDY